MIRPVEKSLRDAMTACNELMPRVSGVDPGSYLANRDPQLITERLVSAIGEANSQATRVDVSPLETIPDALDIIGTRNRVAHGYDEIRNEVIWDVAVRNIPELLTVLKSIIPED